MDGAFAIWTRRNIHSLSDLYVDDNFATFEQLVQKFELPRSHFFRYLQLRNFVSSSSDCFPARPPDSLLDTIFKCKDIHRRSISIIYESLNSFNLTPLVTLRNKWELDLGVTIEEDLWQQIIHRIFSSSICAKHVVIQFKIVHRLHWSKIRLAKIKPDLDPTCDRCGTAPASLLHMFWSCPKVYTFWSAIFKTYSEVCNKQLLPCPLIALFGVVPEDIYVNRLEREMLAFSSLLARRLILTIWKDRNVPTHSHWIREVLYNLRIEKVRYTLQGSAGGFYSIWQSFITFTENMVKVSQSA